MIDTIKFSITIPAFKTNYLKECIDSILCQTYNNFEIVIVDDCSPNDIKGIVDSYSDSRIRYYRNERNCGAIDVVDNWNICLRYCTGDYVICMGDDDKLIPTTLQQYVDLIKKYPGIGLIHGWTEIIDENSDFLELTAPRPEHESVYSMLWNRWDNRKQQFIGDWCFEIEWLRAHGGFYKIPLAWESDDISAIIGASKNGAANTQHIAFQYRRNRYTITNTGNIDLKMLAKKQGKLWYDEFLKKEPTDTLEKKYHQMIKKMFQRHRDKSFANIFAADIKRNPFSFFKWYRKKNEYGYTNKALFFALYMAIKGK